MEIDLIFKIAAIGIIISILNQVLSKSGREEQATMTTLAGLVVVLMIVAQKISDLFDLVKNLFNFFVFVLCLQETRGLRVGREGLNSFSSAYFVRQRARSSLKNETKKRFAQVVQISTL